MDINIDDPESWASMPVANPVPPSSLNMASLVDYLKRLEEESKIPIQGPMDPEFHKIMENATKGIMDKCKECAVANPHWPFLACHVDPMGDFRHPKPNVVVNFKFPESDGHYDMDKLKKTGKKWWLIPLDSFRNQTTTR